MENLIKSSLRTEFFEIVNSASNPLQIIKEALQNSFNANAKEIKICIYRNRDKQFCMEISDNGNGINEFDIEAFLGLGKTFLKSSKLAIYSHHKESKKAFKLIMRNPWDKLNDATLPTYSFEEIPFDKTKKGTRVIIEDYKTNNAEKYFNIKTIREYIKVDFKIILIIDDRLNNEKISIFYKYV